ncbi:alpha beta-hydrolase [Bisporella sp. PMI_857]|nr:alpha beta-hydrolase [Bisporella sp. PMI_857]
MSSQKPTVLFVHGSWHSPKHFESVRKLVEESGYPTECPLQPTFDAKPAPPLISLADDVKVIQDLLTKLIDQEGKDVIVAMHSYGGVVGSEAVLESYSKKLRESSGLPGGVIRLFYMCAFIIPVGASLATALGGSLPPFIKVEENGLCNMEDPHRRFYSDLPKEEQEHWVSELAPGPAIAQQTPLTYTAYQHYPSTYLFCTGDEALPIEVQQMMVERSGAKFDTESCTAGHSPFLSQPEVVLEIIKKISA